MREWEASYDRNRCRSLDVESSTWRIVEANYWISNGCTWGALRGAASVLVGVELIEWSLSVPIVIRCLSFPLVLDVGDTWNYPLVNNAGGFRERPRSLNYIYIYCVCEFIFLLVSNIVLLEKRKAISKGDRGHRRSKYFCYVSAYLSIYCCQNYWTGTSYMGETTGAFFSYAVEFSLDYHRENPRYQPFSVYDDYPGRSYRIHTVT